MSQISEKQTQIWLRGLVNDVTKRKSQATVNTEDTARGK